MDRTQIKKQVNDFKIRCAEIGYPLRDACLVPAFPGLDDTLNLEVYADWIFTMSCSEALDILIDVMFDTIEQENRGVIFMIKILDKNDEVHCISEEEPIKQLVAI